jgi:hypothetical protein
LLQDVAVELEHPPYGSPAPIAVLRLSKLEGFCRARVGHFRFIDGVGRERKKKTKGRRGVARTGAQQQHERGISCSFGWLVQVSLNDLDRQTCKGVFEITDKRVMV